MSAADRNLKVWRLADGQQLLSLHQKTFSKDAWPSVQFTAGELSLPASIACGWDLRVLRLMAAAAAAAVPAAGAELLVQSMLQLVTGLQSLLHLWQAPHPFTPVPSIARCCDTTRNPPATMPVFHCTQTRRWRSTRSPTQSTSTPPPTLAQASEQGGLVTGPKCRHGLACRAAVLPSCCACCQAQHGCS